MEFTGLKDMGHVKNKVMTLNSRKTDFQVLKKLVNRTNRETSLSNIREKTLRMLFMEHKH